MDQLEKYREELMACNEKILEGLLQRNAVVEELMAYKEENKMPMLQPEQEERQRSWLEKQMEGHRHKQEVETVFQAILKSSKKIRRRRPPKRALTSLCAVRSAVRSRTRTSALSAAQGSMKRA